MSYAALERLHVLVMRYWLGSEPVINALTHYIAQTTSLSGTEGMRLSVLLWALSGAWLALMWWVHARKTPRGAVLARCSAC